MQLGLSDDLSDMWGHPGGFPSYQSTTHDTIYKKSISADLCMFKQW